MRHQLECLNKFGRETIFALLAEQGTGKTFIIINNVADLWSSGDCDGLLVFAPNGVHTNWIFELQKHMPDWVRYKAADWTSSPNKTELAALQNLNANAGSGELRILTMNWEAIAAGATKKEESRGFKFALEFALGCRRLMIACDESDSVKNPKALRTIALMKLKRYSYWRRILTGTLINNAPFDAFSQFGFLDESILGSSFYAFKAEYADMVQEGSRLMYAIKQRGNFKGRTPQVVARDENGRLKYKNLDKLSRLIAPYTFRVLKEECLDLPEKVYKTIVFRLTPEQRRIYLKAEQECRLVFENNETTFSKMVAVQKLAQITSGYYLHPDADEPVRIDGDNPKLDMLVERITKIVEDGQKVIIWARYRIENSDICAALEERFRRIAIWRNGMIVAYHGGIATRDRVTAIESFEHGSAQVFVGNQQAGGRGINLTAAHVVFYFSNNFSLRDRLQSEDRAHRIGQTKNVLYFNLVGKGTVDEEVVRALIEKREVADVILDRGPDLFRR
jgi:SNF2 family DNA or RNA helicase